MKRRINVVRGTLNRDLERRRRAGAVMSCVALADYLGGGAARAWDCYIATYGDPLGRWVGDGGKPAERRFWLLCEPILASLLAQVNPGWELDVVVDEQERPRTLLLIRTVADEMDVKAVPITWEPRVVRFGGKAHALASKRAGTVIIRNLAELIAAHFGAPS